MENMSQKSDSDAEVTDEELAEAWEEVLSQEE